MNVLAPRAGGTDHTSLSLRHSHFSPQLPFPPNLPLESDLRGQLSHCKSGKMISFLKKKNQSNLFETYTQVQDLHITPTAKKKKKKKHLKSALFIDENTVLSIQDTTSEYIE